MELGVFIGEQDRPFGVDREGFLFFLKIGQAADFTRFTFLVKCDDLIRFISHCPVPLRG